MQYEFPVFSRKPAGIGLVRAHETTSDYIFWSHAVATFVSERKSQ